MRARFVFFVSVAFSPCMHRAGEIREAHKLGLSRWAGREDARASTHTCLVVPVAETRRKWEILFISGKRERGGGLGGSGRGPLFRALRSR